MVADVREGRVEVLVVRSQAFQLKDKEARIPPDFVARMYGYYYLRDYLLPFYIPIVMLRVCLFEPILGFNTGDIDQ